MNYKYTREHECCLDQMISMVFSNLYNSMEITFFFFFISADCSDNFRLLVRFQVFVFLQSLVALLEALATLKPNRSLVGFVMREKEAQNLKRNDSYILSHLMYKIKAA